MARLPWAKGNLLIAFTPNDIIKELGPCVRPLSVSLSIPSPSLSLSLSLSQTHTGNSREENTKKTYKIAKKTGGRETDEENWRKR